MGCFNVACSISNLSIDCGDPVYLMPLFPNHSTVSPASMLTYPNHFFNPFSLPIKGTYDDYGSIENIEKNENTAAIEQVFGISIEDFVETITGRRGITDTLSGIYDVFARFKEEYKQSFFRVPFDGDFLVQIGFTPKDDGFVFEEFPYTVKFFKPKRDIPAYFGFNVYDSDENIVRSHEGQDCERAIQTIFYELTSYHINVSKENQNKVKVLEQMSVMFIHGDIYETFSNNPGVELAEQYDLFKKETKDRVQMIREIKQGEISEKTWDFFEDKFGIRSMEDLKNETNSMLELLRTYTTMRSSVFGVSGFKRHFSDWPYFDRLYLEHIQNDALGNELLKYAAFYQFMYSANRFLFPAMNGEQHGNREVSKQLLEKSLEITNQKIKEMEEW